MKSNAQVNKQQPCVSCDHIQKGNKQLPDLCQQGKAGPHLFGMLTMKGVRERSVKYNTLVQALVLITGVL